MTIDLHVHSRASDGCLTPNEIIQMAKKKNLKAISITDHDTIDGLAEGMAAAEKFEIEFINGIEFSTIFNEKEIHILGYFLNFTSSKLQSVLKILSVSRKKRAINILEKLAILNINIDYHELEVVVGPGVVGRPHIAKCLVDKKIVGSIEEAFEQYLSYGKPAYVPRYKLTPKEAIDLIHSCQGVAVIAHPGINLDNEIIDSLIALNIDGIEVWHPKHSYDEIIKYRKIAKKNCLLVTGGTDFHCHNEKGEFTLGDMGIPYNVFTELRKKLVSLST